MLNVSSEANLVCELPEFEDSHQQYNFGGNEEVTITCKHYGTPTPTMYITGFNGEIVSAVQKGKQMILCCVSTIMSMCFMLKKFKT